MNQKYGIQCELLNLLKLEFRLLFLPLGFLAVMGREPAGHKSHSLHDSVSSSIMGTGKSLPALMAVLTSSGFTLVGDRRARDINYVATTYHPLLFIPSWAALLQEDPSGLTQPGNVKSWLGNSGPSSEGYFLHMAHPVLGSAFLLQLRHALL